MWGSDRRDRLDAAEERLRVLGERWRPGSAAPGAPDVDPAPQRRLTFGPWNGPALRGLAIVVAVTLALGVYWTWTGRPRAVAVAPVPSPSVPASSLSSVPPAPAPSPPPTPTPASVVVHVVGLVVRPGLVTLPAGSRVADAVDAAGGVTRPRAADSVNLARVVVDGEQIAVGVPATQPGPTSAAGAPAANALVDLNTADLAALDALPGVGPVLAGRILAWRESNGRFGSIDELGEVSGIGDAILGQLRPLVRV
jgi:competence protein ComEA